MVKFLALKLRKLLLVVLMKQLSVLPKSACRQRLLKVLVLALLLKYLQKLRSKCWSVCRLGCLLLPLMPWLSTVRLRTGLVLLALRLVQLVVWGSVLLPRVKLKNAQPKKLQLQPRPKKIAVLLNRLARLCFLRSRLRLVALWLDRSLHCLKIQSFALSKFAKLKNSKHKRRLLMKLTLTIKTAY